MPSSGSEPITADTWGRLALHLQQAGITERMVQSSMSGKADTLAKLMKGLNEHRDVVQRIAEVLTLNPWYLVDRLASAEDALATTPYGDWCLRATRDIEIRRDHRRGPPVPADLDFGLLRDVPVVNGGKYFFANREFSVPGLVPGRDLAWLLLNRGVPETLDRAACYVFPGDNDLWSDTTRRIPEQEPERRAVVLTYHHDPPVQSTWRWWYCGSVENAHVLILPSS